MPTADPCQKEACNIQSCLQKNNYQEEKCAAQLRAMLDCCRKYFDQSNACGGFKKEVEEDLKKNPVKK